MPTTGKSDNAIEFSFDGKNHIPDHATLETIAREAGAADNREAAPAAAAAAEAAPATPDATATPKPDPSPDDIAGHEIEVNGEKFVVTLADLKTGHMRQRDYTQKTQKIAERERELAQREREYQTQLAQRDAELQALDAFLRNQEALDAYRTKAFGTSTRPPAVDPSKPLTVEDVAAIARYNAEQVRQSTLHDVQQQTQAAKTAAEQVRKDIQLEKLEGQIDTFISTIVDKSPLLQKYANGDIETFGDELIGMVMKSQPPRTFDEAKQRLIEAAERKIAVLNRIATDDRKAAAVAAAALKKQSPEPPGGGAVKPAPGKKLTFDHKDRQSRIDAGIETVKAFLDSQG